MTKENDKSNDIEKAHENKPEGYEKHYSEGGFWEKVKKFAVVAGKDVIYRVLLLYYALQDPKCPAKYKAMIYAALGYFISPLDAIPDVIPVVGFSDDLGVLVLCLAAVAMCITAEVREKARQKMRDWFRDEDIPDTDANPLEADIPIKPEE